jgi:outer membrane immunogenic protein
MRKLISTGIFGLGVIIGSPAFAADMGVRGPAPAPYIPYNWTGFYGGIQAGGGWGTQQVTNVTATDSVPAGFVDSPMDLSGALGGFYYGYNYQFNNQFLVGIDGDFSWTGVDGTSTDIGPLNGHTLTHQEDIEWITTVTGRLGYTVNNWLLFAKGGWAWARWDGTSDNQGLNDLRETVIGVGQNAEMRDGWTVGAGFEYGVTEHVSLKLEYDFIGFETANYTSTDVSPTGVVTTSSKSTTSSLNIFKGGVSWRY